MFFATGFAYGRAPARSTRIRAIAPITKPFRGLGGLLFLFLVISQFLAHFNYSNLATIAAVHLRDLHRAAPIWARCRCWSCSFSSPPGQPDHSGRDREWAILAPIFVPLFLKLNVAPAVVLAAYRVGDSPGNVITPLMAYFGLIVIFAQNIKRMRASAPSSR